MKVVNQFIIPKPNESFGTYHYRHTHPSIVTNYARLFECEGDRWFIDLDNGVKEIGKQEAQILLQENA